MNKRIIYNLIGNSNLVYNTAMEIQKIYYDKNLLSKIIHFDKINWRAVYHKEINEHYDSIICKCNNINYYDIVKISDFIKNSTYDYVKPINLLIDNYKFNQFIIDNYIIDTYNSNNSYLIKKLQIEKYIL